MDICNTMGIQTRPAVRQKLHGGTQAIDKTMEKARVNDQISHEQPVNTPSPNWKGD